MISLASPQKEVGRINSKALAKPSASHAGFNDPNFDYEREKLLMERKMKSRRMWEPREKSRSNNQQSTADEDEMNLIKEII